MGSRDHSETCATCGFERGGLNNVPCACDAEPAATLQRTIVAERQRHVVELALRDVEVAKLRTLVARACDATETENIARRIDEIRKEAGL
jgi:hypothetical protein